MWETYYLPEILENRKRWMDAQIKMLDDPEYWESRIDFFEQQRCKYHKKAAWSASDVKAVDEIDAEIKKMNDHLDSMYGIEPEIKKTNPILGSDWWIDQNSDGWVSSK